MIVANLIKRIPDASAVTAFLPLLDEVLKAHLTSFDNVTFVERYPLTNTDQYRWIYAIDGFDAFYLAIQNERNYNLNFQVRVYLRDYVYTDTHLFNISLTAKSIDNYTAGLDIYSISENNVLKALATVGSAALNTQFVTFLSQDNDKYVLYANSTSSLNAFSNNNDGVRSYVNMNESPKVSTAEVALKKHAILTDNTQSNSAFVDILKDMYEIINNQFSTMTNALVAIDGVKYRQIYPNYMFVKDGDTE